MTPHAVLRADVNPAGWKAPTAFARRGGGRAGVGTAPSVEVEAYKSALREALIPQYDGEPIEDEVFLVWHFARKLNRYQGPSGRWVTKKKNDLTNLIKSSEDALQPNIIKNDVQVVGCCAYIDAQGVDVEEPYVELEIYAASAKDSLHSRSRTHP